MRTLSFRSKLLLAMMLVVVGGTGATVLVTQRSVAASYRTLSRQQFETEVRLLAALYVEIMRPAMSYPYCRSLSCVR